LTKKKFSQNAKAKIFFAQIGTFQILKTFSYFLERNRMENEQKEQRVLYQIGFFRPIFRPISPFGRENRESTQWCPIYTLKGRKVVQKRRREDREFEEDFDEIGPKVDGANSQKYHTRYKNKEDL